MQRCLGVVRLLAFVAAWYWVGTCFSVELYRVPVPVGTVPVSTLLEDGLVLNLSSLELTAIRDREVRSTHQVAVGHPWTPTPVGRFTIVSRVRDPVWYPRGRAPVPPGPDNPLGDWWLGLDLAGYGLHGTPDPTSLGRAVSAGCVRLSNHDVATLAEQYGAGTTVLALDQPVEMRRDDLGRMWAFVWASPYQASSGVGAVALALTEMGLELSSGSVGNVSSGLADDPPGPGAPAAFEVLAPGWAHGARIAGRVTVGGVVAPVRELARVAGRPVWYDHVERCAVVDGMAVPGLVIGDRWHVELVSFARLFGLDLGMAQGQTWWVKRASAPSPAKVGQCPEEDQPQATENIGSKIMLGNPVLRDSPGQ